MIIVRTIALVIIALLVLPSLTLTGLAQRDNTTKTINLQIIVDASGSMSAPTDTSVVRMDAAKTVLNEVISQLPNVENVKVGLRASG